MQKHGLHVTFHAPSFTAVVKLHLTRQSCIGVLCATPHLTGNATWTRLSLATILLRVCAILSPASKLSYARHSGAKHICGTLVLVSRRLASQICVAKITSVQEPIAELLRFCSWLHQPLN